MLTTRDRKVSKEILRLGTSERKELDLGLEGGGGFSVPGDGVGAATIPLVTFSLGDMVFLLSVLGTELGAVGTVAGREEVGGYRKVIK